MHTVAGDFHLEQTTVWCVAGIPMCSLLPLFEGGGLGGGVGVCDRTKRKTHQGRHRRTTSDLLLWGGECCSSSILALQEEDALSYVAGFTVANDVSARDWQMKRNGKQWLLGKTFDSFCPLGPALVTTGTIKGDRPRHYSLICIFGVMSCYLNLWIWSQWILMNEQDGGGGGYRPVDSDPFTPRSSQSGCPLSR